MPDSHYKTLSLYSIDIDMYVYLVKYRYCMSGYRYSPLQEQHLVHLPLSPLQMETW